MPYLRKLGEMETTERERERERASLEKADIKHRSPGTAPRKHKERRELTKVQGRVGRLKQGPVDLRERTELQDREGSRNSSGTGSLDSFKSHRPRVYEGSQAAFRAHGAAMLA